MKYLLTIAYDDYTCKSEISDLPNIMQALAIYMEDPGFFLAHITRLDTGEVIATFKSE